MIPTPDLSHLKAADYEHVYEPAEDTFLLLDALEQDADLLRALKPRICLEIGSGSGCVSAFLGSILGSSTAYVTTDINPFAAESTLRTGIQNKIPINPVIASLALPFRTRLTKSVDVLLFNPPYVPTEANEAISAQDIADIRGSWAGGADGMAITNVLLNQVDDLLSAQGCFYLVALKQNNIEEIQRKMAGQFDLHGKIILQRRAGREHLFILRFARTPRLIVE